MKKYAVGVDIGGTKISVSLGNLKGKILSKTVFPARANNPLMSCDEICKAITKCLCDDGVLRREIIGVGVCAPGQIDSLNGLIVSSPNLKRWTNFPVRKRLERCLKLPVTLENDANAAALGEQRFGAGKNVDNFIYVTVSTGIGSGIVANGELVRGCSGGAGEIGHMTVVPGGNLCGCGKRGCLEAYASGTAIEKFVQNEIRKGCRSKHFSPYKVSEITGQVVAKAAKEGDGLAIRAREMAAGYLGLGLANVINLLNPERVILGGGVMTDTHHFWKPMMSTVQREAWRFHYHSCKIIQSKLGARVGDLGAMALVLEQVKSEKRKVKRRNQKVF